MEEQGTLTCPKCGGTTKRPIREGICEVMYDCRACGERITATECCCVMCEYGDTRCPVSTVTAAEEASRKESQ